jgi:dCMP deaminase
MSWDSKYINLAKEVSTWSKDPSTKVGAVAVGPIGQVLSIGYNGLPRGIEDTEERLNNREIKYSLVVHAEMNCIYNASYIGASLLGASIFVYGLPICNECAKGIIQTGVKRVVMPLDNKETDRWKGSIELTSQMFNEAGIEITYV